MLKRLLGAQWLSIGFVGAISFALSVFIARRFGPETFGVYAQAISLGAFLAILIDGGFGKLLMRETVRSSSELNVETNVLHGFAFGHGLVVIAVLTVFVLINPFPLHWPTMLATLAAFGISVFGNFSLIILKGQGRLVRDAAWQMLSRIFTAACMAFGLYWGASSPWELLTYQFAGGAMFLLFLMRAGWVRPVFKIPRKIYAMVLPLVGLDLATVVYFRSDMLLFKLMDTPKSDVGAYGVAYRLIEAVLLLATPVAMLLFRRFRLSSADWNQRALLSVLRLAALAAALGFLVFLIALPAANAFFLGVFGDAFESAGGLFKVLSLMLVFALANGVLGQAVFALGMDKQYLLAASAAAVFSIVGNILLLSHFGVLAAAWMTVATEFVLGVGLSVALYVAWKKGNYAD